MSPTDILYSMRLFNNGIDDRERSVSLGEHVDSYYIAHGPHSYAQGLGIGASVCNLLYWIEDIEASGTITVDIYEVTIDADWDFHHNEFVIRRDGDIDRPADSGGLLLNDDGVDGEYVLSQTTLVLDGERCAKIAEQDTAVREMVSTELQRNANRGRNL